MKNKTLAPIAAQDSRQFVSHGIPLVTMLTDKFQISPDCLFEKITSGELYFKLKKKSFLQRLFHGTKRN